MSAPRKAAPGARRRATGRGKLASGSVVPAAAVRVVQSEASWQAEIETLAALRGWICWHDRDSRMNDAGFPDLLLIRERVVWIEVKKESGVLTKPQIAFLAALQHAGQEVYVMRPSNLGDVLRVLA